MTLKQQLELHEKRLATHNKQIATIRDLVEAGMRLVVGTRKDMRELLAAQKRTEASLRALIPPR